VGGSETPGYRYGTRCSGDYCSLKLISIVTATSTG
jgi:hypothetical protein